MFNSSIPSIYDNIVYLNLYIGGGRYQKNEESSMVKKNSLCQVQDSNPHLPIIKEGYVSDYTNLACLLNTLIRFSYISLFQNERNVEKKQRTKIKK